MDTNILQEQYNYYKNYLTERQFNHICKYWIIANNLNKQLNNTNWSKLEYDSWYDSEEFITNCINYNTNLNDTFLKLLGKMEYYDTEIKKYINKIGYELNDKTQDENLFNLLNNGLLQNGIDLYII